MEDDRLLTGRPRFSSKQEQLHPPLSHNISLNCKAMSTQTIDLPDLSSRDQPSKRLLKSHQALSPIRFKYNNYPTRKSPPNDPHTNDHDESFPATSLDLILAKLDELDAIKSHLTTFDNRFDHLQPQSNVTGLVAQRS